VHLFFPFPLFNPPLSIWGVSREDHCVFFLVGVLDPLLSSRLRFGFFFFLFFFAASARADSSPSLSDAKDVAAINPTILISRWDRAAASSSFLFSFLTAPFPPFEPVEQLLQRIFCPRPFSAALRDDLPFPSFLVMFQHFFFFLVDHALAFQIAKIVFFFSPPSLVTFATSRSSPVFFFSVPRRIFDKEHIIHFRIFPRFAPVNHSRLIRTLQADSNHRISPRMFPLPFLSARRRCH